MGECKDFLERRGVTFQVATLAGLILFVVSMTTVAITWREKTDAELKAVRVEQAAIIGRLDRLEGVIETVRAAGAIRDVQYAQIMVELQYIKQTLDTRLR